ncbi:3-keto-5-aminohexanoate cleavage protein [Pararhizobium sp. IMCC21322]|uniref:3-keto-5-aminohexanoate cleavage protein n=1 Tax=Pararhizobium sp. IMCC21322 TaxID=3067903 RepID=UPI002740D215|nr:3-keto-5-aminohexanoate cleavage protein [Pararhizobium sp. IMCC21322]
MIHHRPLPNIMVAPNGARRTKADHPAIPLTQSELVETAIACQKAGADGIHLHIRDEQGLHLLDAAGYAQLLEALMAAVPEMYLQVTSEAAGRYETGEQIAIVRALKPDHVSVALREMAPSPEAWPAARDFYHWAAEANVAIQHILYTPKEVAAFLGALDAGKIPGTHHLLQFVLGDYQGTRISRLDDIQSLLDLLGSSSAHTFDWMLCAFGREETDCLTEAVRLGGKVRVGFENSLWNQDGSLAVDNTERVHEISRSVQAS